MAYIYPPDITFQKCIFFATFSTVKNMKSILRLHEQIGYKILFS